MNGDQLCAVRECRLDLHIEDHFGYAIHHLIASQNGATVIHQLGDRLAITGLQNRSTDQRNRFRMIEF